MNEIEGLREEGPGVKLSKSAAVHYNSTMPQDVPNHPEHHINSFTNAKYHTNINLNTGKGESTITGKKTDRKEQKEKFFNNNIESPQNNHTTSVSLLNCGLLSFASYS